ncbi:MAG: MMPL family transporter [Ferruginibacter sp.]|nr:MMPL family transporter [Ferruginibacter sp.]
MWQRLGKFVIKNRLVLLVLLGLATVVMGYYASKVKLSYEFSRAIPTDNPKYQEYLFFKKTFGDDGNMLVIGLQAGKGVPTSGVPDSLFILKNFNAYQQMQREIKKLPAVEDILGIPGAIGLQKDSVSEKLTAQRIFPETIVSQAVLDSAAGVFFNLPFYNALLYNPATHAYLMGIKINKDQLNSPARTKIVADITAAVQKFEKATGNNAHLSGLPLIRTVIADRIQKEMKFFLFGSLALSVIILLLFFRSISTTLLSLAVVITGVIWTVATIYLCGYNITLLTALLPSLVVVIGIPNCIYFINKYHTSYLKSGDKSQSLVDMVSKMGVVTLFCNITAAIGFAVFALTRSAILKEFGVVAGISIMVIFVISFILLPAVLSYLPSPGSGQLKYLKNKWINNLLGRIERWVFNHKKWVLGVTTLVVLLSIAGMMRLKSVAFIVDDLPKKDKIYTDLKFFESNFKGVMPLEILIDTKKPKGMLSSSIDIRRVAAFQDSILAVQPRVGKPLSLVDGIKFSYQAVSQGSGDSTYTLPAFGNPLADLHKVLREIQIRKQNQEMTANDSAMSKLIGSFVDSSERYLRISMSMADIGTKQLPELLDTIKLKADQYLDSNYKVTLTGSSISFLEGSKFIISGLKESIFWAFLLIALCMLYLFRSFKILVCSLVPNLIPLLITAGIMGWAGIALKPSTVLIFSVALGIAVDITIRFLVNYRQDLPLNDYDIQKTVKSTLHQTGLSIIYTSLVLTAGFIIFCGSSFGGTFALGWLTSVTLLSATLTNLVLLPVLIILIAPNKKTVNGK